MKIKQKRHERHQRHDISHGITHGKLSGDQCLGCLACLNGFSTGNGGVKNE